MRKIICLLASFLSGTALAQTQADPEAATGLTAKPPVIAKTHMIVTANPHASAAGAQMLDSGGSAADAMIAALLTLNVVEPQSSGIGGGAFAVVHSTDGITSWDGRETAPAAATPDMFMANGDTLPFWTAVRSSHSIGAPGLLRLMEALHQRHGQLEWSALFEPAIRLAEDGFEISPRLAGLLSRYGQRLAGTDVAESFLPGGTPLAAGQLFKQPALAETLQLLAREGATAFYDGPLAEEIGARVQAQPMPGTLTAADLAGYQAIERRALCHPWRDMQICGMGPPSSGATTVGQIMMLLDRTAQDTHSLAGPSLWHLFAEASRLAYADRAKYLADSDHVKVPTKGLLDPSYMDERARLVPRVASTSKAIAGDPPWREGRLYAPDLQEDLPGTTHVSVVDENGLAISVTASIETAFGSGRMVGGFILNNQLTDFSFRPVDASGEPIANSVAPNKRPRSSMSPTIVLKDGAPVLLAGSPGGSRIPEYVAQSILAVLGFGLDPAAAVALPHVSQRNRGSVAVEPEMPPRIVHGLKAFGHQLETREMTSGLHLIQIKPDGTMVGGADPRREGVAIGR